MVIIKILTKLFTSNIHKCIALVIFGNMFEMCFYKHPDRDKLGLFASLDAASAKCRKSVGK